MVQMFNQNTSWICCQLGAREHYAIPRALFQRRRLTHLITDAWVSPNSLLDQLPTRNVAKLRERYHPALAFAPVTSFTGSLIHFELSQILRQSSGWKRIMARNNWFQVHTVQVLKRDTPKLKNRPIIFAYSYVALETFRYAKAQGWRTILGQIDPGPIHEQVVLQEHRQKPIYKSNWQPAPDDYWRNWREECALADQIIVNSRWSSEALQQVGIPTGKISIIPLAYERSEVITPSMRRYPQSFTIERPLRALFLGQINLSKGIASLLEAAQLLRDQPIEFWLVGPRSIAKPKEIQTLQQVKWLGPVSRGTTANYYRSGDVFLFPTLSDGFGLTQLEAQAWKLPLITSRFCGQVVADQVNGLLLPEVSGPAIADALLYCLRNPGQLQRFAQNAVPAAEFGLGQLQSHLLRLADPNPVC